MAREKGWGEDSGGGLSLLRVISVAGPAHDLGPGQTSCSRRAFAPFRGTAWPSKSGGERSLRTGKGTAQGKVIYLERRRTAEVTQRLTRLLTEHEAALRRFLRGRLALEADRDDLVQDVFLRLSQHRDLERIDGNARAYLFKIAMNLLRDRKRRSRTRQADKHVLYEEGQCPSGEMNPEEAALMNEWVGEARQVLLELSPKCRRVFIMHRFEYHTYREIADELGISVSMVEKYVTRALKACRNKLGHEK